MAKSQLVITLRMSELSGLLESFKKLDDVGKVRIKEAGQAAAQKMAAFIRAAGKAQGGQAAAVADTVTTPKDRLPAVVVGGPKRVGQSRVPAWRIVFGSEFGMTKRTGWYWKARYGTSGGLQFGHTHRGTQGIWIFPTVDKHSPTIMREYADAARDIVFIFEK